MSIRAVAERMYTLAAWIWDRPTVQQGRWHQTAQEGWHPEDVKWHLEQAEPAVLHHTDVICHAFCTLCIYRQGQALASATGESSLAVCANMCSFRSAYVGVEYTPHSAQESPVLLASWQVTMSPTSGGECVCLRSPLVDTSAGATLEAKCSTVRLCWKVIRSCKPLLPANPLHDLSRHRARQQADGSEQHWHQACTLTEGTRQCGRHAISKRQAPP